MTQETAAGVAGKNEEKRSFVINIHLFSLDFFFYLSVGGNNDDGLCVGWLGVKSPFLRALLQSSFSSLIGLFLRIACGNKGFLLLLLCSKVPCLDLFRGAAAAATEGVQLGEQQWCT